MNTPTRQAPHIWCQVFWNTSLSWAPVMPTRNAVMIQETRIAVPPTPGAQLKAAATLLPCSIDEAAATESLKGTYFGRSDHGPVHNTTTTTSTTNGSQARKTSAAEKLWAPPSLACSAVETTLPP